MRDPVPTATIRCRQWLMSSSRLYRRLACEDSLRDTRLMVMLQLVQLSRVSQNQAVARRVVKISNTTTSVKQRSPSRKTGSRKPSWKLPDVSRLSHSSEVVPTHLRGLRKLPSIPEESSEDELQQDQVTSHLQTPVKVIPLGRKTSDERARRLGG